MKKLFFIFLLLAGCGGGNHYETAIIGDSRVEMGSWEHLGVCNHGSNGDSTLGVLSRLDEVIDHAGKVYLQVGRNDIAYFGWSVESTLYRYDRIIKTLEAAGIEVIVFSTIPDYELHPETNRMVAELNAELSSWPINYVDINIDLAPGGWLLYHTDGVHPDAEGYQLWYDYFLNFSKP